MTNPKSNEFKAAMSAVRERIATAKRRETHRGFIDYNGCINVCHDFQGILEDASKVADNGAFAFAYSVAALIQINLAKLASSADDSAGGITDTKSYVDEVLEKACSGVEYGSDEARFIFLQSLKDSTNKAFDGWDEFAYDILQKTARLAEEETEQKMYAVIDDLYSKLSKKPYSSWCKEPDAFIRLEIIKATHGEVDADSFIKANLDINGIRKVAIQNAMNNGDYTRAEILCLEKISDNESIHSYSRPSEWQYLIFDVYDKSNNIQRKTEVARDLLFKFDIKYYSVLKQLLIEQDTWEGEYNGLLAALGSSLPCHMFMDILSKESETAKLIDEIRKHPSNIFTYGKQLSKEYPSDTYAICCEDIRKQAGESDNRTKYKKVCGNIKKLFDFGGTHEAEGIIAELILKYPRRPAFLEELNSMSSKFAKKRK